MSEITVEQRFWKFVDKTERCWTWRGSRQSAGYGLFSIAGLTVYAHRAAWELLRGPIPSGLEIDHLCRNRACVNPDHLEPVTTRVNSLRSDNLGGVNARKTHCPKGHPYDEPNTWVDKSNRRHCRTCRVETTRRWRARAHV